jgi:hypothetical protein
VLVRKEALWYANSHLSVGTVCGHFLGLLLHPMALHKHGAHTPPNAT